MFRLCYERGHDDEWSGPLNKSSKIKSSKPHSSQSGRASLPVIALVTAYNEEETIGGVLDALAGAPSVDRIQVVDDGSCDATASRVREREGVTLISLPRRVPVGEAIMRHLDDLSGEAILLWCDADLTGLTPRHVEAVLSRFRQGDVMQSLSSRAVPPSWPGLLQAKVVQRLWAAMFGPISGERAILLSDFRAAIRLARAMEWSEMMRGYGIVLFLNWYGAAYGGGKTITYCPGLRQRQKYQKWGGRLGWRAGWEMVRQWGQFAACWMKIRINARRIEAVRARLGEGG